MITGENKSNVSFTIDDSGKLNVKLNTQRLILESVKESDTFDYYNELWSQPEVTELYTSGKIKDLDSVQKKVSVLVEKYSANNPFSSLCVRKKDDETFVGQIRVMDGKGSGEAEISYIFAKRHWKCGYGKESINAVITTWVEEIVKRGYKVNKNVSNNFEGEEFQTLVANSHPDNLGSIKILENTCGMRFYKQDQKYGHLRNFYKKQINRVDVSLG